MSGPVSPRYRVHLYSDGFGVFDVHHGGKPVPAPEGTPGTFRGA